jgi:hypothetical protein
MIIFNWYAIPMIAGSLTAGGLLWAGLEALGLTRHFAFGAGAAVAGVILVFFDYVRLRRRTAPTTPLWRLIMPHAGGQLFFIPCWALGALCILAGCLEIGGPLAIDNDSVLSALLTIVGLGGFLVPLAYEYFLPIELTGKESWEE